jgi:nucleoside-diphosphate kinase
MERTLIIVKPEGVQRGLIGNVITRLEQRGLKFVGLKLLQITPALGVVEGPNAISVVRTTMGATNAAEAIPGTIRGDYALEIGFNIIHGSDGPETATQEIDLFFRPEELLSYTLISDQWVYEQ